MESKMLAEIRFRWLRFESPPRLIKMHDQPPLYIYIQISVLFIIALGQTFTNAEPATTGSSDNNAMVKRKFELLLPLTYWILSRQNCTHIFIHSAFKYAQFFFTGANIEMIDNKHDRHVHIPWYTYSELIQCSTVNISDAFNEDSDFFF